MKMIKQRKEILESIEEMVDSMLEYGNTPYAIICNRRTFGIIAKKIRKLDRFRELDNIIPEQLWFKYSFGDIPLIKNKYCPRDTVYAVDKHTYEKIIKEK